MNINSLDIGWLLAALDCANEVWLRTWSVSLTVLATADSVIEINAAIMRGERPPQDCYCVDHEASTELYACRCCAFLTPCKDRSECFLGLRICGSCLKEFEGNRDESNGCFYWLMEKRLTVTIDCELSWIEGSTRTGEDAKRLQATLEHIGNVHTDHGCSGMQYWDSYRQLKCEIISPGHPEQPSADTVSPFWRTSDGTFRAHVADNVEVTATCLNFTKQLLDIGSLQHIAEYQRSEQTVEDKATLLNALEPLQIIQARYPHLMLHQLAVGEDAGADSSDRWEATWTEWHTGVPQLSALGREQARSTVYSLCYGLRFVCRWTDDERQALIDIGEELIIFFGLDNAAIPRSADGLIWPFANDISEEWEFTMAYTVGQVRLCKMRNACNRHHETVDSPMGIICEIFFRLLGRKSAGHDGTWEFSEMLGLDALLATHHALNVSIAHKRHGFQMRTGWPMSPRKLADREDSLNNILVETIFTNRLKYCYPERLYPLPIKIMRVVNVAQRIHYPSKAGIVKDGSTPYGLASGGQVQSEQTDSEGDCLPGAHFNTDFLEVMKVVSEEIAEDEEGDTSEEEDENSDAIESSAPTKHNLKKRKAETEVADSD